MSTPKPALYPPWQSLTNHLGKWYCQPDLEALDIALTVACSHYLTESDPIWLFVIGPSRSGKTSIVINGLSGLPQTHIISDLTPRTLVSGMNVGQGQTSPSLLHQIGPSGILLFKDFTTFLSKRHDDQIEIASQLREIHDGRYVRKTGTGQSLEWQGKIGIIAACTGAVERAWATQRELGERFVQIRWPRIGGSELAKASGRQVGKEREILRITRELCLAYSEERSTLADMDGNAETYLSYLAELTARLRGQVVRESYGERRLIDVCVAEEPSSLFKALSIIARTHAGMWKRNVCRDDLKLAQRVAHDSVAATRKNLLDQMPKDGSSVARSEIARRFNLPPTSIHYHAEEMAAHKLISLHQDPVSEIHTYRYHKEIMAIREEMNFSLSEVPVSYMS